MRADKWIPDRAGAARLSGMTFRRFVINSVALLGSCNQHHHVILDKPAEPARFRIHFSASTGGDKISALEA
jgi:hypothetical protein